MYCCDRFKTCKVLGDLDPIFKVIVLYGGYLLNQWMDFLQTYIDIPLGQAKELIKFLVTLTSFSRSEEDLNM